jgi:hypothetical protein
LPDDGKRKSEETKNEADELAREFRVAEKWVIGTNIALAIIGTIALCIYYGQLKVMQGQLGEIVKQYPEIQKSAHAAEEAAKAAKIAADNGAAAFHADQRAWIMTSFRSDETAHVVDGRLQESLHFVNTGKTPASNIRGVFFVNLFDNGKSPDFRAAERTLSQFSEGTIKTGNKSTVDSTGMDVGTLFPNSPRDIAARGAHVLPVQMAKYPTQAYIAFYGIIAYSDVFQHRHWIHFCSFECGNVAESLKDPRMKCAEYNGVDNDVE